MTAANAVRPIPGLRPIALRPATLKPRAPLLGLVCSSSYRPDHRPFPRSERSLRLVQDRQHLSPGGTELMPHAGESIAYVIAMRVHRQRPRVYSLGTDEVILLLEQSAVIVEGIGIIRIHRQRPLVHGLGTDKVVFLLEQSAEIAESGDMLRIHRQRPLVHGLSTDKVILPEQDAEIAESICMLRVNRQRPLVHGLSTDKVILLLEQDTVITESVGMLRVHRQRPLVHGLGTDKIILLLELITVSVESSGLLRVSDMARSTGVAPVLALDAVVSLAICIPP